MDLAGDRLSGYATHAVKFGPRKTFFAGFAVIVLANAYLCALCVYRILPFRLLLLPLVAFPFCVWLFRRAAALGAGHEGSRRFREGYRALYLFLGVAWAAYALADTFKVFV